ncbi:hypothetical protein [Candidatus Sororendozoicomonas aggregata]|uniref:hypothetical protein n=1 Tax=Candidatus Sororendozoicomonas aggregata TaxID=3073239 RepID=UPI002ED637BC
MRILAFICEACKNYNLTDTDEHGGAVCISCGLRCGPDSERFFDFDRPVTAAVLGCGSLQRPGWNACWHPYTVDTYDCRSSIEPTIVTDLNSPSFKDLRICHYDIVLMEYLPDLHHLGSPWLLLKPGGLLFILQGGLDLSWLVLEKQAAETGGKDEHNITVESVRILYQAKGAVTFGHSGSSCISREALSFIYSHFFWGKRCYDISPSNCLFFFKKK